MTPQPLQILSRFVAGVRNEHLDVPVRTHGVVSVLDATAAALRAGDEDSAARLRTVLAGPSTGPSRGPASVWGTSLRTTAPVAAQLNGTAAHAHFHDDTDMAAWSHPGSLLVPACLAVAERADISATELVRGVVCGYATLHWLGARGEVAATAVQRGLRASSFLGPLAAAAAAANLMGLDAPTTASAVGIAADLAGGTVEPVRSGHASWRLQNGWAGHLGVLAADLAAEGQRTGPSSLGTGWLRVATGQTEAPQRWHEPPALDDVLQVWQKHSATLGDNIAASACALTLRERVLPDDMASVVVRIAREFAEYPGTSYRGPFTRVDQALASTAFAVATALVHGSLDYDLQRTHLEDPEVLAVVARVEVEGVDSFGYLDAEVEVHGARTARVTSAELPRSWFHNDLSDAGRHLAEAARARGLDDPTPVLRGLDAVAAGGSAELSARELACALSKH